MSEAVTLAPVAARGMIMLRGDFSDRAFKRAVKSAIGCSVPACRAVAGAPTSGAGVVWMSPDELLLVMEYDAVSSALETIRKVLSGSHFLAEDVSDARVVFRLEGPAAAGVLARLAPVDLHPDHFKPGAARRTRLAQIPAAFWRDETGFDVICFRSVHGYAEALLDRAVQTVLLACAEGTTVA